MKDLLVIASLGVLLWLIYILLRLPPQYVPAILVAYLGAQAIFTLAGWLGSWRWGYVHTHYAQVYLVTMIPVLVLAFALVCWASWPTMWPLPLGVLAMTVALYYAGRMVIPNAKLGTVQIGAALFIACGVGLLCGGIQDTNVVWNRIAAGFGLFWLAEGFFHYHWAVGIVRHREATAMKGYLLPGLIACAIWGWLAISLSTLQGELSREAESVRSIQVPQPANERR